MDGKKICADSQVFVRAGGRSKWADNGLTIDLVPQEAVRKVVPALHGLVYLDEKGRQNFRNRPIRERHFDFSDSLQRNPAARSAAELGGGCGERSPALVPHRNYSWTFCPPRAMKVAAHRVGSTEGRMSLQRPYSYFLSNSAPHRNPALVPESGTPRRSASKTPAAPKSTALLLVHREPQPHSLRLNRTATQVKREGTGNAPASFACAITEPSVASTEKLAGARNCLSGRISRPLAPAPNSRLLVAGSCSESNCKSLQTPASFGRAHTMSLQLSSLGVDPRSMNISGRNSMRGPGRNSMARPRAELHGAAPGELPWRPERNAHG